MNNFFKMSLVAAAIAVSGTAAAGTFTGNNATVTKVTANENAIVFSSQGLAKIGSDLQAGPVISYKLGAAYIVGDELTFTFESRTDGTNEDPIPVVTAAGFDAKTVFPANISVDTAQFNLISAVGNKVTYRVVSGVANTGSLFVITQEKKTLADLSDSTKAGLVFAANILNDGTDSLYVKASATKNNVDGEYDVDTTVGAASLLALSTTQFGKSEVTQLLNAVIDNSDAGGQKKFVTGTDDAFSVVYTAPTVMPTKALLGTNDGINDLTATDDKVDPVMTVNTDLPFVDVAKFTFKSAVADAVVTTVVNATKTDVVVTYPKGTTVPSDTVTITPKTGTSAPVMKTAPYAFNASIVAGAETIMVSTSAGTWTAEGDFEVTIPYMPYGTGLSQVIYANNNSKSDVEVSAVATDENGNEYPLGVVSAAKAGAVTKLSTPIKNALEAEGFTSGKVAIVITFRGSTADVDLDGTIQVHSGYNANASDRGFVANTTNGAK